MSEPTTSSPGAGSHSPGEVLFARYAYAPNDLGYCGPADSRGLFELGATGTTDADVAAIARRFSGAWIYLQLLAELTGIDDPLDERVVRAYWVGGELLDQVDRAEFGRRLLAYVATQAGQYWTHLTGELVAEAAPTHAFHVLGVYPWSRLLVGEAWEVPLQVLDDCRIRAAEVVARAGPDKLLVRVESLAWDGDRLRVTEPVERVVRHSVDGAGFVTDAAPGEVVAVHWDWVSDRLTDADVAALRRWTGWQLEVTNQRFARDARRRSV